MNLILFFWNLNNHVFPRRWGLKENIIKNRKSSCIKFYIYDSNNNNRKPYEIKATHKRIALNDIKKILNVNTVRLFNSDGA